MNTKTTVKDEALIQEWDGRAVYFGVEDEAALTERGVEYFVQPETKLLEIGP